MATRRKYDQACGTAYALDVVGDRWALLVVRELVLGPRRFTDLRDGLPGIGPNVLSERLKQLEESAVIRRRVLPPPAASTVYELTDWGAELEDIVVRLGRWGVRSPNLQLDNTEARPEWLMLGMRAVYAPDGDPGRITYEFRFGGDPFWASTDAAALTVGRGSAEAPDAVLTADVETVAKLVRGQLKPGAALRSGTVKLAGDRSAFEHFPALFKFPPPPFAVTL